MNVLVWHVHGSWMTAFVQGPHRYLVPVVPDRGPDGLGRARTWDWPPSVVEVSPEELRDADIDVVVLQRPRDAELAEEWLGRRLTVLPVVYVEHDTPLDLRDPTHRMADRDDVTLVHVTAFNRTMWRSGSTPVHVVEHGVVDPGHRWSPDVAAAVCAINEPVRREWVAGSDLVRHVRRVAPVDLFGMQSEELGGRDVAQGELHTEMARRALYLHPFRWTSLGLSLIEAMMLGMPVVALGATEVPRVLTPDVGAVVHDADEMAAAVCGLLHDTDRAARCGAAARALARERFSVDRFLRDWDDVLGSLV